MSYALPLALKLFFTTKESFPSGPFSLGVWSRYLNAVALLCQVAGFTFCFFPTTSPTSASNMNYSVVIMSLVFTIAAINWQYNLCGTTYKGATRASGIEILKSLLDSSEAQSSHDNDSMERLLFN
jgi:hypothetical protein